MRVYLAAPFAAKDTISKYADELRTAKFEVASTWHDIDVKPEPETTGAATALDDAAAKSAARTDLAQIMRADVLVLFSPATVLRLETQILLGPAGEELKKATARYHSTGRHFEAGYAYANNVRIVHVGEPESIFTRALCAVQLDDWHQTVLHLVAHRQDRWEATS